MSSSDDLQKRLARLDRLRRLGLQRGVSNLKAARPAQGEAPSHVVRPATESPTRPGADGRAAGRALGQIDGDGGLIPVPLPGKEVVTPFGVAWARTVRYPLAEFPRLTDWLHTPLAALAALERNDALALMTPSRVAFIDTETTGLSPGTGTYAFLIGLGTFELPSSSATTDGTFVVRQFFMRHPGEERAQLHLVEQALDNCDGLVSFNGRSFDMPLLTNRFVLAGMPPPMPAAPHLDLLPPARRLWHAHLGSCRLTNLERSVLQFDRPLDDVPGYLIPGIYQQYFRTGIVSDMLVRVFEHNLYDILAMPLLAAHMARFFREDITSDELAELPPLACFSLGRYYEALGWHQASVTAYRTALAASLPPAWRSQVLRKLSSLYKRIAQWELAAALWEEWVSTDPHQELTPYVELARYHEWHTGDLRAAHGWAAWALHIAELSALGPGRDVLVADLRHRLARLERKLGRADNVLSHPNWQ
ncbi:MAG: ribonuclease H-like domain-containing protein [Anaerolineae bacterium]